MRLASIVGHVLELCSLTESNTKPADKIVWDFFKQRKYLGSRDRFQISASIFGMQRDWRLIETLVQTFVVTSSPELQFPEGQERFLPLYIAHAVVILHKPAEELIEGLNELWIKFYPSIQLPEFITWLETHVEEITHSSNTVERLGITYSFPDWMVERLLNQYGEETESLLKSLNTSARVTLRVNLLKISLEDCRKRLLHEGIETIPTQLSPVGLVAEKRFNKQASQSYKEGLYEFQDEGSQLISLIANPQPNDIVIDACSGGGGKTLHMFEMMNGKGRVIASDIDLDRMKGLQARKERSEIHNIELTSIDRLNRKELTGKANLVLVDAPCSGVGRIRRNPEMKRFLKESEIEGYPSKQLSILQNVADFVKVGGRLVYATCSLFKCENENVVIGFLAQRKDFKLVSPLAEVEKLGVKSDEDVFLRILPNRYPTDGFFVALMERI